MLIYCFSIYNADGSTREVTGRMVLAHDKAACAFGKAMMRGDAALYAGCSMDVAKGNRSVCCIRFPLDKFRPPRLDNLGTGKVLGERAGEAI